MTLDQHGRRLLGVAVETIPRVVGKAPGDAQSVLRGLAAQAAEVRSHLAQRLREATLGGGSTETLDQEAKDSNTRRRDGESNAELAERLRTCEDALTIPALESVANGILTAAGISGVCKIVQVRQAKVFLRSAWLSPAPGSVTVTTHGTTGSTTREYRVHAIYRRTADGALLWSVPGVDDATDGPATLTADNYMGITWLAPTPPTGHTLAGYAVVRLQPVATMGILVKPAVGTLAASDTGAAILRLGSPVRSYVSRGCRLSHDGRPHRIIVICPYGTPSATREAIREAIRQRKAAGMVAAYETRATAP